MHQDTKSARLIAVCKRNFRSYGLRVRGYGLLGLVRVTLVRFTFIGLPRLRFCGHSGLVPVMQVLF